MPLPLQATPFLGRDEELQELSQLLDSPGVRLVSILGPGGMGKSRLAIPAALAEALGFQFHPREDPWRQLCSYARNRELLVLMDNFEHLVSEAAIVAELLEADAPAEDQRFGAIDLFAEHARRVQRDFQLSSQSVREVARICRLTEGMPLGIVLAASWVTPLEPREIADEIAKSIDFLATAAPDVPLRQRSLRAVFEHSWSLLSPEEQAAFGRISVFRGGFTRQAAKAVAGADLGTLAAYSRAEALTLEELVLARGLFPFMEGLVHARFAEILKEAGRWQEALEQCELAKQTDNRLAIALTTLQIADIAEQRGDRATAEQGFRDCLAAFEHLSIDGGIVQASDHLAVFALERGDAQQARLQFRRALRHAVASNYWPGAASVLAGIARGPMLATDVERSAQLLGLLRRSPVTPQQTRQRRLEPLSRELLRVLPAVALEAALSQGERLDLRATCREILAGPLGTGAPRTARAQAPPRRIFQGAAGNGVEIFGAANQRGAGLFRRGSSPRLTRRPGSAVPLARAIPQARRTDPCSFAPRHRSRRKG